MTNKIHKILPYIPGVLFLIFWQIFVEGDQRREFLFASPLAIWKVFVEDFISGEILYDIWLTSFETVMGLLIGFILGTVIGLILWLDERIAHISKPYIVILGSIPIFALAPLMIIWFGTGLLSKVIMAAFSVVLVSLIQVYEAALNVNQDHIKIAKSFGASRLQILKTIMIPSTIKWIIIGLKINVGFALIGAFIGEFISAERGVGHYILKSGSLYDVPRVLFGIAILSIMGLVLVKIITLISNRFLKKYTYNHD